MRKLQVSGDYYFDNDDWISWWGDVELDDEQVANLIKLIGIIYFELVIIGKIARARPSTAVVC